MDPKALIESLVDVVIKEGGSDLHLSAGRMPSIRVATQLITLANGKVMTQEDMMAILGVLLAKEKVDRFLSEQEIDFSYDHKGVARLRGNAFFHKGAIGMAFRLIPKVRTFADLKLPESLKEFAKKKQKEKKKNFSSGSAFEKMYKILHEKPAKHEARKITAPRKKAAVKKKKVIRKR